MWIQRSCVVSTFSLSSKSNSNVSLFSGCMKGKVNSCIVEEKRDLLFFVCKETILYRIAKVLKNRGLLLHFRIDRQVQRGCILAVPQWLHKEKLGVRGERDKWINCGRTPVIQHITCLMQHKGCYASLVQGFPGPLVLRHWVLCWPVPHVEAWSA